MSFGSPPIESTAAPEPAQPREIRALWVWLAVALVALVANLRQPLDPDIWFQLLAGQYTLDHWAIPRHEFFLYAGATEPQVFGGWGFGLIHELGVRLMGPFSLSLVNSMMWSGVLLLALAAARLRNGRAISSALTWPETAGLMLAMLVVFQGFLPRTQMRAEVTLYLAWMATLVMFEKARLQGAMRQYFLSAPLIAWGLAWLHTGGFLLLGLIGACAMQRMFDLGWKAFWRTEGRWHVLCLVATAVLPVLNPNGVFQVYAHLVNLVQGLTGTLPASPLPDRTIVEYLPLWAEPSRRNWPAAGFLVIAMLIMLSTRTQRRLVDWLLILPLVAMSCLHVRSLGLLAMAVCVPLCASVSAWMGRRDGEAGQGTIMQDRAAKGLLAFLTFAMLWIGSSALSWGWQSRSSAYPAQGILETIRQRSPEGARVFTDERLSSQIPYRLGLKYQVPFAGHTLIRNVPAEGHFMTVRDTNAGWLAEMRRYDVDYAIVPVMQGPEAYTLSVALVLSPEWDLLTLDGGTALFAKRKPGAPLDARAHWLKGMRFYTQMELISRVQGLSDVSEATVKLLKEMRGHEDKPEGFEWPDVRSMDPAHRTTGASGGTK